MRRERTTEDSGRAGEVPLRRNELSAGNAHRGPARRVGKERRHASGEILRVARGGEEARLVRHHGVRHPAEAAGDHRAALRLGL
jgi:hypothetical protein